MVHVALWLLKRESVIRGSWGKQQFMAGWPAEEAGEGKRGNAIRINVDLIGAAVRSEFFWRYIEMLCRDIAGIGEDLVRWFSACPCHGIEGDRQSAVSRALKTYMKGHLTPAENAGISLVPWQGSGHQKWLLATTWITSGSADIRRKQISNRGWPM